MERLFEFRHSAFAHGAHVRNASSQSDPIVNRHGNTEMKLPMLDHSKHPPSLNGFTPVLVSIVSFVRRIKPDHQVLKKSYMFVLRVARIPIHRQPARLLQNACDLRQSPEWIKPVKTLRAGRYVEGAVAKGNGFSRAGYVAKLVIRCNTLLDHGEAWIRGDGWYAAPDQGSASLAGACANINGSRICSDVALRDEPIVELRRVSGTKTSVCFRAKIEGILHAS